MNKLKSVFNKKHFTQWCQCIVCQSTLLPVGQLKSVIETIIGKNIQRKSLIRRIESADMFETIDEKVKSGGRLAQQYKVKPDVDIVNFERNLST